MPLGLLASEPVDLALSRSLGRLEHVCLLGSVVELEHACLLGLCVELEHTCLLGFCVELEHACSLRSCVVLRGTLAVLPMFMQHSVFARMLGTSL